MREIARRLVPGVGWRTGVVDEGSPNGGSESVQTATVTVTSAQILDLHNTPVTLVAGVEGKLLVPLAVSYSTAGGTPYTSGGNNRLQVGGTIGAIGTLVAFGSVISDPVSAPVGFDIQAAAVAADVAGGAIEMAASDPNTDGDFDVDVTVRYVIVDVT